MSSGLEASLYVEKLRQTLLYLDVSDVRMEEGSMRCDVNISIKPEGSDVFGTKVEIKNLNSINNIKLAIDYEANRQKEALEKGETIYQETRRFDEKTGITVSMRKKEGAVDYKYFPEPNIFPILLSDEMLNEVRNNMPELPDQKHDRYIKEYGLSDAEASTLIQNKEMSLYYDEMMKKAKNAKSALNLLMSELQGLLVKNNQNITNTKVQSESLAILSNMIEDKEISGKQAKDVLEAMLDGSDPRKIVKDRGMKQVSDEGAILSIVNAVLDENPNSIADYKGGKDRAMGFLVGQVMKKSKGQANPQMASKLVKQELDKR